MVTRISLTQIRQTDVDFYRNNSNRYTYPYVCHGCGQELGVGDRVYNLINTNNAGAIWGGCCARQFPLNGEVEF